jgi:hypothetical protein
VAKNAKISASKLNLKAKNINVKILLKPSYKLWVEAACLGENWFGKKLPKGRNFAQSGHTGWSLQKWTRVQVTGSKK